MQICHGIQSGPLGWQLLQIDSYQVASMLGFRTFHNFHPEHKY